MNLERVSEPRVSWLPADQNARLEHYARYYEHVHGEPVDTKAPIPEILHAFLQAGREFQSWSRSADSQPHRVAIPGSIQLPRQGPTVICINEVPADVLRTCSRLTVTG